jgi:Luciferase-like monooxygenase
MQIGIDSFAAAISDPATGLTLSPVERMHHLLEEIELADRVGLDLFGIGEHHRAEFLDSAPVVILSAAATRTENIRLTSAVTVLSASDPRSRFSGVCDSRSHLAGPRRNGCRSRFVR